MSGPLDTEALAPLAQEILQRYPDRRAATIPLLHLIQEREGRISPEAEAWVGGTVGVSLAHVREVVSFYTRFRRELPAKCRIEVCTGMSCWLRGSDDVLRHLEERLGIKPGQATADGRFSLETVECLCACEIAPMAQINGAYVGPLTREAADRVLTDQGSDHPGAAE